MNKKYLSVILFGALMLGTTGTFTSCKDYDDDINNLQEQIDKLATKEDMEAKLSQMQAAIDAAKATAEDALAKAEAAGDSKEIEALKARVQALEDAAIDVEALKAEIKASVDTQLDAFRTEMNTLIQKVEGLVGKLADMVTSVELVYSFTADQQVSKPELSFTTAIEQDNVFEEGIANAIPFKKGNQRQTPSTFIVRVSPANAVLTPEMISLVNSQGENLDDMLTVKSVKKYNGLLTRAAENSGLWEVEVELTQYDEKAFEAATKTKDGKILFAAQVNNTLTEETASRYVTSSYDLTLAWNEYKPANGLNYFVNDENIEGINNRYSFGTSTDKCLSLPYYNGKDTPYEELTWSGATAVAGTDKNTKTDTGDDRHAEKAYPAVQGEDIVISLTSSDTEIKTPDNIRAMYVTLDYEENAVESAPSEWNAWNSYKYTGLNTVVEGTELTITINPGEGQSIINDFIGFRVYAVNYDGTLVDPDGKAFYVKVGNPAEDWNTVNTVIIPDATKATTPSQEKSAKEAVTLTKLTDASVAKWVTDKIGDNAAVFNVVFEDKDGKVLYTASSANANPSGVDFSKVTKVYTVPTIENWATYVDNKAYNGTLTISNADGFVLATINVSMTKQLPGKPEGFSIKTNQLDEKGVYNCYLIPSKDGEKEHWTAKEATQGFMDMDDVFNWGKNNVPSQYVISFAEAKTENNKTVTNDVNGADNLKVTKDFIDNSKQHATTVSYNYGPISSENKKDDVIVDYVVEVETFPTVFNCIYNDTYKWHWASIDEIAKEYKNEWAEKNPDGSYKYQAPSTDLVYGTDRVFESPTGNKFGFDWVILGVSSRDSKYNAWLSEPYLKSLILKKYDNGAFAAHVISKGNKEVDEYFKVVEKDGYLSFEATQISDQTNPTAPVPSTLQMTYIDMYGHEITFELDMTVLPR